MTRRVRFTLQQSSQQVDLSLAKQRSDAVRAFQRGALVTGFTEVFRLRQRVMLRVEAARHGQKFYDGEGDGAFAVSLSAVVVGRGSEQVIDRSARHRPVTLNWIVVEYEGETIVVFEAHWLTGYRKNDYRHALHRVVTERLAELIEAHGLGRTLVFWMGDTNVDDQKDNPEYDEVLEQARMVSIWDEAGRYPVTHRKNKTTIDLIGRWLRDSRVTLVDAAAHLRRYKDHADVTAEFIVTQRKEKS